MFVCVNGKFVDKKEAKLSVFDHGLMYGDGIYETIAVVDGKIIWLGEHLDRLIEGCGLIYLNIPWSRQKLIELAEVTFQKNGVKEGIVKVIVTRGTGGGLISDTEKCEPNLIIFSSEFTFLDKELSEKGMRLMTVSYQRFFPRVKSLNCLPGVLGYLDARESGHDDALFVDTDGNVREGTTFNIFSVKDGVLKTPLDGVLKGVTAVKVLELGGKLGFDTEKHTLSLGELLAADEVFVTSTTRKVIPVVQVDTTPINSGKIGEVTKQLMRKFSEIYY